LPPPIITAEQQARNSSLEFRHGLNRSADEADVGDLEDRGVLVLVDGDDGLAVLHAGQVLDRARDADRDVDFGGDDLAGLADL
jgi:Ethanolamine utilization protein EutJ (predicted chaperonin)